jgi:hypothetical protein
MAKIHTTGFIKIYRELAEKPIWENSTAEQKVILITLLLMANFGEKQWEWRGKKFTAKPGQFVTSLENITKSAGTGISKQNVRTALKRFENLEFLTSQSTHRGRLITIVNWGLYQGKDKELTKCLTKTQHSPNIVLTPKEECKKDKKVRKNIYRRVQHLEFTQEDFEKLLVKYSQVEIDDVLDAMENWAGLKKYKSAYLTANSWLKRSKAEKPKSGKRQAFGKSKGDSKYDHLVVNMMED